MLSKSLKFSIVLAVMMAIFSGTALADRGGHEARHPGKWDRGHHHNHHEKKWDNHYRARHRRPYVRTHVVVRHPVYHQKHQVVYKTHPLAPRIAFLGPIPIPVPPPPHEVLNYLAGH